MSSGDKQPDPDDFFAETRMSFGEHIEDLRTHMLRAVKGFLIALVFSFFVGKQVLAFIARPVEEQLAAFYDERVRRVSEDLKANDTDMLRANEPRQIELLFPRTEVEQRLKLKLDPTVLTVLKKDDKEVQYVSLTAEF